MAGIYRSLWTPIADIAKLKSLMSENFSQCFVYLEFINYPLGDPNEVAEGEHDLVRPSAGTVTVKASENNVNFGSMIGGTDIAVSSEDYTRPSVSGLVTMVKAEPTGIAGAVTHYRLKVARY